RKVVPLNVILGNRGTVPIRREDFDGGKSISMDVRELRKIYYVEQAEPHPGRWRVGTSRPSDHILAIKPLLLNPGDQITMKAVLVGEPVDTLTARLAGFPLDTWRPVCTARIANIIRYWQPPLLVRLGLSPGDRRRLIYLTQTVAFGTSYLAVVYLA